MEVETLPNPTTGPLLPSKKADVDWPLPTPAPPEHEKMAGVNALMAAILADAVDCFLGRSTLLHGLPRAQSMRQAARYIRSTDKDWLFSFESCCMVLGLDADDFRRRLAAQRASQPKERGATTTSLVRKRAVGSRWSHKMSASR